MEEEKTGMGNMSLWKRGLDVKEEGEGIIWRMKKEWEVKKVYVKKMKYWKRSSKYDESHKKYKEEKFNVKRAEKRECLNLE